MKSAKNAVEADRIPRKAFKRPGRAAQTLDVLNAQLENLISQIGLVTAQRDSSPTIRWLRPPLYGAKPRTLRALLSVLIISALLYELMI
jgi:hypothetical protein